MVRIISTIVLVLSVVLFPPAVLALVSNNAVPGDVTYPIKRFLEDRIYNVASLNSTTKGWFAAARSDKRFDEIKVLVDRGQSTTVTLNELIAQTNTAVTEISKISNKVEKGKLLAQVEKSIDKYDQSLKQLSEKPAQTPTQTPVSTAIPQPTQQGVIVRRENPTAVPTQAPAAQQPNTGGVSPQDLERQRQEFERARRELEEIRRKAEEERIRIEDQKRLDEERRRVLEEQRRADAERAAQNNATANTNQPNTPTNNTANAGDQIPASNPIQAAVRTLPEDDEGDVIDIPNPTVQPDPTTPPCVQPASPSGLSYNDGTKTVAWSVTSGSFTYNVRLVDPTGTQHNYDGITNNWYTFPESAVSTPGNYSWWVDVVNECGTARDGASFTVS